MGKVLKELENNSHWEATMQRMLDKRFLSNDAKLEVVHHFYLKGSKVYVDSIRNGEYRFGECEKRVLKKPNSTKTRTVYIHGAEDRFVLGAMYRAFSEVFRSEVSPNVFSYKKGKGTISAIDYLLGDKRLHEKIGIKMDIRAYFNSVSVESLKKVVNEITEEDLEIRELLSSLLFNDEVYFEGKKITEYKSLVPGNPFSSFLANYCLKSLDMFVVNELNLTYARYSDDIILFADSREELNKATVEVEKKLEELGLKFNESKYEEFSPKDEVSYLGLKILDGVVDISEESKEKFKRKIKRAIKRGRQEVERDGKNPYKVAWKILREYNSRVYKSYIKDKTRFGWAYYSFRYINTLESLQELDFYFKDRLRYLITGSNNSANHLRVSDEKIEELGYHSLCKMMKMFKSDFDYYCDTVDLM